MANGSGGSDKVAWVLSILLALVFFLAGFMKLAATEELAANFFKFGYPVWFGYVIALTELGAALLLLAPKVASYAAGLLLLVMLGATYSHLSVGETPQALIPLTLAVLLGVVAYRRRPAGA